MPRDVTVTFQDGSTHVYKNAPDDLTPEQVTARASQEFGKPVTSLDGGKKASGLIDTVVDKVKSWGSDLARGALALPTMLADDARSSPEAQQLRQAAGSLFPGAKPQLDAAAAAVPPNAAQATLQKALPRDPTANPYRTAALEAIGTQLTMPVWGLGLKGMSGAVGGGIGSEAAAQTLGEGPLQRFLGGLAGGAGSNWVVTLQRFLSGLAGGPGSNWAVNAATNRIRPQTAAAAKEAVEGISDAQLKAAQAFQAAAKTKFNVDLDLAQALEATGVPANNLTTIRNALANSRHGTKTQQLLRGQPETVELATTLTKDMLPGKVIGLPQAANNVQEAATSVVNAAKAARTELWETTLQKSLDALEKSRLPALQQATAQSSALQKARAALEAELPNLQKEVSRQAEIDAGAVAAANAKLADIQKKIAALETFTLPRGNSTGNTGRFLSEARRGESIDFDAIKREVDASALKRALVPAVTPAPSLPLLQAQRKLAAGETALSEAKAAEEAGAAAVRAAENFVGEVRRVPSAVVNRQIAYIERLAQERPNTPLEGMLRNLAKDLEGLSDARQINEVLKANAAKAKTATLNTPGMDAGASNFLYSQINVLRDNFGAAFSPYKAANNAYKVFTDEVLNPLKQGPVGQAATARGYLTDKAASIPNALRVFEQGVDPSAPVSPVKLLGTELNKQDPTVFQDAFKSWLSDKLLNGAASKLSPGQAQPRDYAATVYNDLFKDPRKWQGMQDAVGIIAQQNGIPASDAVKGLRNLAMMVRGAANQPKSVGGLSPTDLTQLGSTSTAANVLRIFGFLPFERAARAIEDATLGKTLRTFDDLLTSPDGAATLAKLGKTSVMSPAFAATLQGFAVGGGQAAQGADRLDIANNPGY